MRRLLFTLFICYLIIGCSEENGILEPVSEPMIRGSVHDSFLKIGIAQVDVLYQNTAITRTDSNGYFQIDPALLKRVGSTIPLTFICFPYKPSTINLQYPLRQTHRDTFYLELPKELKMYQYFLKKAIDNDYQVIPVIDWFRNYEMLTNERVVIMRHDVDTDTITAMALGYIEYQLKSRSTFYFRWSTASRRAISYVHGLDHEIGLHYETLSTYGTENNINRKDAVTDEVLEHCRELLKIEINKFKSLFGNIYSICAHGDAWNKKLGIPNFVLMQGQNTADFKIETWAYSPEVKERASIYISDSGDKWTPISFEAGIDQSYQHIYVLIHPMWWNGM